MKKTKIGFGLDEINIVNSEDVKSYDEKGNLNEVATCLTPLS